MVRTGSRNSRDRRFSPECVEPVAVYAVRRVPGPVTVSTEDDHIGLCSPSDVPTPASAADTEAVR